MTERVPEKEVEEERVVERDVAPSSDDYYDIWDDYDSDDPQVTEEENESKENSSTSTGGRSTSNNKAFLDDLPPDIYCDLVTTLDKRYPLPAPFPPHPCPLSAPFPPLSARCYEQSILEIWDFDRDIIYGLSREDILDAINSLTVR